MQIKLKLVKERRLRRESLIHKNLVMWCDVYVSVNILSEGINGSIYITDKWSSALLNFETLLFDPSLTWIA